MAESVYVSGPMRGYKDNNYPRFHEVTKKLRAIGYFVYNPAENFDGDQTLKYEQYMREDFRQVCDCDIIAMIPGWGSSEGARAELAVARHCGIEVMCADSLCAINVKDNVLEQADKVVNGARQRSYGHPMNNFKRTAKIWEGILDTEVTPQQVALCMMGIKIARECNEPKEDNAVDLAGYALTLDMCNKYVDKRGK